jgi:hypothetical protein
MRQRKLRERLRALILATPLIGIPGCSSLPPCPPPETTIFSLAPRFDSGVWIDGGEDCTLTCLSIDETRFYNARCSLLTLPDGGPGVSCTTSGLCVGGRRPASLLASRNARKMREARPESIWRRRFSRRLRPLVLGATMICAPGCFQGPALGRRRRWKPQRESCTSSSTE